MHYLNIYVTVTSLVASVSALPVVISCQMVPRHRRSTFGRRWSDGLELAVNQHIRDLVMISTGSFTQSMKTWLMAV